MVCGGCGQVGRSVVFPVGLATNLELERVITQNQLMVDAHAMVKRERLGHVLLLNAQVIIGFSSSSCAGWRVSV